MREEDHTVKASKQAPDRNYKDLLAFPSSAKPLAIDAKGRLGHPRTPATTSPLSSKPIAMAY
jgi:hypothetical protein